MRRPIKSPSSRRAVEVADRLHSSAIQLLRRLRQSDADSGLGPARLSALSVIVFAGPIRLGDLAAAEQVRAPTMTRIVSALEEDGLVTRMPDPDDGRAQRIRATPRGTRLLQEGRERRVRVLAERLMDLEEGDVEVLERAAALVEALTAADVSR